MNGTKPIVAIGNAYNAGKDPCECQASVHAQTFTDWESTCVDDGSTDDSPAILDEDAAKGSRMHFAYNYPSRLSYLLVFARRAAFSPRGGGLSVASLFLMGLFC